MIERERWHPLLKTDGNIYQKGEKTLIVSEKEFTLQTKDKILKRERPKEFEPIKEELPTCGGCEQTININDPEIVYLRYEGKHYHEDCFRVQEKTPEEIIFRESPIKDSVYESQKWLYESRKREMNKNKLST